MFYVSLLRYRVYYKTQEAFVNLSIYFYGCQSVKTDALDLCVSTCTCTPTDFHAEVEQTCATLASVAAQRVCFWGTRTHTHTHIHTHSGRNWNQVRMITLMFMRNLVRSQVDRSTFQQYFGDPVTSKEKEKSLTNLFRTTVINKVFEFSSHNIWQRTTCKSVDQEDKECGGN